MGKNKFTDNPQEEEQSFSLPNFLRMCLFNWRWFIASIVLCLGLTYLYAMRQEPVYERSCQILIKDQEDGATAEISNQFSRMGFVSNKTNVNNELISLTSPAVMYEVVNRLNLTMNYQKEGGIHPITLYGSNNPIKVVLPDADNDTSLGFSATVGKDGTVKLYDFWKNVGGVRTDYDKTVSTRTGFNFVSTPVGRVGVQPNGAFQGTITEPLDIRIWKSPIQEASLKYSSQLAGDLENPDADVIKLVVNDVSIQRANDILNTLVDVYNANWVTDKNRIAVATSNFINERLNVIEEELGEVDSNISDFKSRNKIPDVKASMEKKLQESSLVKNGLIQSRNQLAMAQYMKDFIKNPKNTYSIIPVNVGYNMNYLSQDVSVYNNLVLERQNLISNSGPNNPIVREIESRIKGLREAILASIVNNIGTLEAGLRDMEKTEGESQNELSEAPTQAKYLLSVERQQKVKEELYLFLLQKREENELSQTFTAYNTRIITPPWGPQTPVAPKTGILLFVALILGIAIPAVVIYLVETTNTKIRSRKDLDALDAPFLGEIPYVGSKNSFKNLFRSKKAKRSEVQQLKYLVKEGKRDIVNESFRVIRSNLDFMISNHEKNVLMLTSFNPGSGKSFISFNLGASFALKKRRVIVIDGDLRHGSLSAYVNAPKKGLSNYLAGSTDNWESLLVKNAFGSGVDIMPIGKRPPNPAELLENGSLQTLLNELKAHYDLVIFDCPPVNIVVDTQIIAHYCDRTIFVVRAGMLERSAINELCKYYEDKKFNNIGIVLNATRDSYSTYYYYGSRHYGNYYNTESDDD